MILNLEEDIDKMTMQYDDFVEAIEKYEQMPTNRNKKKVIEKHKIFGATKVRIMSKIRSFLLY